jgi:hypothetical protein
MFVYKLSVIAFVFVSVLIPIGCGDSSNDDYAGKHYADALDKANTVKCAANLKQLGTEVSVIMIQREGINPSELPNGSELWEFLKNTAGTMGLRDSSTKCPITKLKYRGPAETAKINWGDLDDSLIIGMCPKCGNVLKSSNVIATYQKDSKEYKEAMGLTLE